MKNFKRKMESILKKGGKIFNLLLFSFIIFTLFSKSAYAANGEEPVLISGTKQLLTDAGKWLLGIIPVGAGLMLGYQAFGKTMTDDSAIIAEKNKFMKNVLIGAIIAECASGLVILILGYYGGK